MHYMPTVKVIKKKFSPLDRTRYSITLPESVWKMGVRLAAENKRDLSHQIESLIESAAMQQWIIGGKKERS